MTAQYCLINCNKCATLIEEVSNRVNLALGYSDRVGLRLSAQFSCKDKAKNAMYFKVCVHKHCFLWFLTSHAEVWPSKGSENSSHFFKDSLRGRPSILLFFSLPSLLLAANGTPAPISSSWTQNKYVLSTSLSLSERILPTCQLMWTCSCLARINF